VTIHLSDDEIVVLAIRDLGHYWFVSERDYWVLDLVAWENAFREAGYDVPEAGEDERFGMPLVDERNAREFLEFMKPFRSTTQALRGCQTFDGEDALPGLIVDFDRRTVDIGPWVQSPAFEKYLPPGWSANFRGILNAVPPEKRFWQ